MTDNPLSSLIQLCLLIFVICFILAAMYAVINHKLISNLSYVRSLHAMSSHNSPNGCSGCLMMHRATRE